MVARVVMWAAIGLLVFAMARHVPKLPVLFQ
jgi:hypothetical protein